MSQINEDNASRSNIISALMNHINNFESTDKSDVIQDLLNSATTDTLVELAVRQNIIKQ